MEEIGIADVLQDAIGGARDHRKMGPAKLFEAQNVLEMLKATDSRLLIAIGGSLALLFTLIAIMGLLSNISGYMQKMESCFRSSCAKLCQVGSMMRNLIKPQEINKEYVKIEIQDSIEKFRSVKEQLKLMKSKNVDKKDVKEIKAAIKTIRSIQEHLKEIKSQGGNEEEVEEIEVIIQPAIKAADSMEKIINKGVWLIGHS